jgi:hypothetical protein
LTNDRVVVREQDVAALLITPSHSSERHADEDRRTAPAVDSIWRSAPMAFPHAHQTDAAGIDRRIRRIESHAVVLDDQRYVIGVAFERDAT